MFCGDLKLSIFVSKDLMTKIESVMLEKVILKTWLGCTLQVNMC
jgi:hypothetical protein